MNDNDHRAEAKTQSAQPLSLSMPMDSGTHIQLMDELTATLARASLSHDKGLLEQFDAFMLVALRGVQAAERVLQEMEGTENGREVVSRRGFVYPAQPKVELLTVPPADERLAEVERRADAANARYEDYVSGLPRSEDSGGDCAFP